MLQAIIGALCGVGLFFVLADVYRIPYLKTSKAVESLSKLNEPIRMAFRHRGNKLVGISGAIDHNIIRKLL